MEIEFIIDRKRVHFVYLLGAINFRKVVVVDAADE